MDTISPSFQTKKQKILDDLSLPEDEYSDLSPKGSVDVNIRPLIRDINGLPGVVTTSSCAGRISVFLEGGRAPNPESRSGASGYLRRTDQDVAVEREEDQTEQQDQFTPRGGKGSGKWLFVSHDPVTIGGNEEDSAIEDRTAHELFGLMPGDGKLDANETGQLRLVRFHFEPMILHTMSSSLHQAQPILSAASSSGFRESGLQSLRCLSDSSAHPIVAIRSSGLALESVIGYYSDRDECARSLVHEEYLCMLVSLANERFKVNAERVERFRGKLMELFSRPSGGLPSRRAGWEDPEARRERKRAEGLLKKESARKGDPKSDESTGEKETDLAFSFLY